MPKEELHNEKELLHLVAQNSEYAFAILVDHYHKKVYSTALHLLKDPVQAEEVVQDIFLKLWLKRAEAEGLGNLGSYIAAMTRNQVFDHFKKKAYEVQYKKEIGSQEDLVDNADHRVRSFQLSQIIQRAVNRLPARQKQVYELSRVQGLTMEEIARTLSISKSTAKGHLTAALQSIREYLANSYSDALPGFGAVSLLTLLFCP